METAFTRQMPFNVAQQLHLVKAAYTAGMLTCSRARTPHDQPLNKGMVTGPCRYGPTDWPMQDNSDTADTHGPRMLFKRPFSLTSKRCKGTMRSSSLPQRTVFVKGEAIATPPGPPNPISTWNSIHR